MSGAAPELIYLDLRGNLLSEAGTASLVSPHLPFLMFPACLYVPCLSLCALPFLVCPAFPCVPCPSLCSQRKLLCRALALLIVLSNNSHTCSLAPVTSTPSIHVCWQSHAHHTLLAHWWVESCLLDQAKPLFATFDMSRHQTIGAKHGGCCVVLVHVCIVCPSRTRCLLAHCTTLPCQLLLLCTLLSHVQ